MLKTASLCLTVVAAGLAGTASADTLFENPSSGAGFAGNNLDSPGNPSLRHYALTKVEVGGLGWNIDRVSMYNQTATGASLGAYTADVHLHIVPDAVLAAFDPTLEADVFSGAQTDNEVLSLSSFRGAGTTRFTADPTLDITIGPGTYWIGVTPITDNLSPLGSGWQFAWSGANVGEGVGYAEAGALTGTSTTPSTSGAWEARSAPYAILIEGTNAPEPGSLALLGLGGLGLLRRRR